MKRTLLSIILGLVLAAVVYPVLVYAAGCYATFQAMDPETGELVTCYLYTENPPCRYHCPFGDIESGGN